MQCIDIGRYPHNPQPTIHTYHTGVAFLGGSIQTTNPSMVRFLSIISFCLIEFGARKVSGQVVNEFDTSTGGFRLTCDPAPGVCTWEESYESYSYSNIEHNLVGSKFYAFKDESSYFIAQDCKDANCTFVCDGVCGCESGVWTASGAGSGFEPDGGSCPIVSTSPGIVPTESPTGAPSSSPTFNVDSAILYNATDMQEPTVMSFSCEGKANVEDYCDNVNGRLTLQIVGVDYRAWSNCMDDSCVMACSPVCTCEIATRAIDGVGWDTSVPVQPCPVLDRTMSPSMSPSMAPTDDDSSSPANSLGRCMGGLLLVVGSFWILL
jgi:hypothetical protein